MKCKILLHKNEKSKFSDKKIIFLELQYLLCFKFAIELCDIFGKHYTNTFNI